MQGSDTQSTHASSLCTCCSQELALQPLPSPVPCLWPLALLLQQLQGPWPSSYPLPLLLHLLLPSPPFAFAAAAAVAFDVGFSLPLAAAFALPVAAAAALWAPLGGTRAPSPPQPAMRSNLSKSSSAPAETQTKGGHFTTVKPNPLDFAASLGEGGAPATRPGTMGAPAS